MTLARLAGHAANSIKTAFEAYQARFELITRRARGRFEQRDWHAAQRDARERLELYSAVVNTSLAHLRQMLGEAVQDRPVWAEMKAAYAATVAGRPDEELAETFFNSITRRIFATVGVNPDIEFVEDNHKDRLAGLGKPVYDIYRRRGGLDELVGDILRAYTFDVPWQDAQRDARLVAAEIEAALQAAGKHDLPDSIEIIRPVFYRGKGAYLVGRVRCHEISLPLALALRNPDGQVAVDAVLLSQAEVNILFSFTRSYFRVDMRRVGDLVAYLSIILPQKRIYELYTALGHHKHGKTELYRDLHRHLAQTTDRFEPAWGEKGMVMAVFTLPSFNIVFKIIRDRFAYPKTATRQEVMAKYQLVFKHDRAGRLIDAQEFEHLEFDRARFTPELLAELQAEAGSSVRVEGERVVIRHLYTERRVTPLNLVRAPCTAPGATRSRARLRPGHPRPGSRQYLPRRPAAKELRRHAPGKGNLLRLRRAVRAV
jgi:isocitrate dehydrogenase kinase/phosphatase